MDSLAKMNLLSSLSADLGVTLQVETLAKHPTARSLAEAIDAGGEAVAAAPSKKYELPKTGWTHGFFRLWEGCFRKHLCDRCRGQYSWGFSQ